VPRTVDRQTVELELADELRVDQLAFEEIGVLFDQRRRAAGLLVDDVAVRTGGETALLQGVADVEVGQAQPVLADLRAKAQQAVDDDPVVGDHRLEVGLRNAGEFGIQRRLLRRVARAPRVRIARARDDAEAAAADVERRAAADVRAEIGGNVEIALEQAWFRHCAARTRSRAAVRAWSRRTCRSSPRRAAPSGSRGNRRRIPSESRSLP
jgi:hypothetical protein